jgi:hypothetical protein
MARGSRRIIRMATVSVVASGWVALSLVSSGAASGSANSKIRPIVCTAASQPTETSPVLISGCNRYKITGGHGSFDGNGPYTLTWGSGSTFTFSKDSVATPPSRCPSGTAEVDFRGTILSGSGFRTHRFINRVVAYDACVSVGLTVVVTGLVPGTEFTIG